MPEEDQTAVQPVHNERGSDAEGSNHKARGQDLKKERKTRFPS